MRLPQNAENLTGLTSGLDTFILRLGIVLPLFLIQRQQKTFIMSFLYCLTHSGKCIHMPKYSPAQARTNSAGGEMSVR